MNFLGLIQSRQCGKFLLLRVTLTLLEFAL